MKTHAFPIQLTKEAILLEKYSDALTLLKPLSATNHPEAQFLHAYLHFWDDDLNQADAIQLMNDLADANHTEANYVLAACPDLVPPYTFNAPDTQIAFERIAHASEAGSDFALTDLAECYLHGNFVEQDIEKARQLLETVFRRVERNNYHSKNCYLLGQVLVQTGDKANLKEAIHMLVRSVYSEDGLYSRKALSLIQSYTSDIKDIISADGIKQIEQELAQQVEKLPSVWQRFLRHYCLKTLEYDLRGISVDTFMDFVFDHWPRLPAWRDQKWDEWYRQAKVIFSPPEILKLYTEMFQSANLIAERYSPTHIKQGLNPIRGNWTLGCVLSDENSSVEDGEACIRAMYDLFVHLFQRADFVTTGYMWWDIGYGGCDDNLRLKLKAQKHKRSPEKRQRLLQATFETQVRVLQMKNLDCQEAALHGLQHYDHPDTQEALRQYLRDNPDLPSSHREYALGIIKDKST